MDGVRVFSTSLTRTINIPADFYDQDAATPDLVTALSLAGINPEAERSVRAFPLVAGRYLETDDAGAALISRTLADTLHLDVGGSFRIPSADGTTTLTVVGILQAQIAPGNETIWVNLPEAQAMMNTADKVNIININTDTMAMEERRVQVQRNIEAALGDHSSTLGADAVSSPYASRFSALNQRKP